MNCLKCNEEADYVYRPDLDLTGIGMCKEHKEEIETDIMIATFEGWESFEKKYLTNKLKQKG